MSLNQSNVIAIGLDIYVYGGGGQRGRLLKFKSWNHENKDIDEFGSCARLFWEERKGGTNIYRTREKFTSQTTWLMHQFFNILNLKDWLIFSTSKFNKIQDAIVVSHPCTNGVISHTMTNSLNAQVSIHKGFSYKLPRIAIWLYLWTFWIFLVVISEVLIKGTAHTNTHNILDT